MVNGAASTGRHTRCAACRERPSTEFFTPRRPLQQFGNEVAGPVIRADVVHGKNVGMLQRATARASCSKRRRRSASQAKDSGRSSAGRLFIEPIEMLYAWAAKNDDALSKLRRRRKKHTPSRDKAMKVQ
jgi:hypothetical protein